jgi:16S rRNA (uracil1498-N3)-methyltransferase
MVEAPPRIRLYVEAGLAGGADIELGPEQAHYLLHVLRLPTGGAIALFNGRDGEWRARLTQAAKKTAHLKVESCLRQQDMEADLWLLFAPVKRARIDLIVEKATEMGVSQLQPVLTLRTNVARIGTPRLRLIAIEAAEQCERLTVPELRPAASLAQLLAAWPFGRRLLLLDESGGGQPIGPWLAAQQPAATALLVGPEGGFAKSELDALDRLAFATRVGMGRRILRADTAVVAALACYQAICGDWREPSP